MNLLALPARNAIRSPRRTFLTAVSIGVSVALIVILRSVLLEILQPTGLNEAVPRLVVRHRTSLTMSLPRPYEGKIAKLPGVLAITPMNWFQGVWKDDQMKHFFPRFAVDPQHFFDVFIDYHVLTPGALEVFRKERTACLVGDKLAERQGFKVGDKIILKGDIYPADLELTIAGIFAGPQADWCVFPIEYLDEALGTTTRAGTFFLLANSTERAQELIPEIENMFRNADAQVKAETEKSFQLSFVEMLGNIKLLINSIVSVVIFAIMMIAASTMSMAIRERTREIATMKAIGFTQGHVLGLVVAEGMVVSLLGGGLGLMAAYFFLPSPRLFFGFIAGVVTTGIFGVSLMLVSMALPERPGESRLKSFLHGVREIITANGPWVAICLGLFIFLVLVRLMPPMDWFAASNGTIQSIHVRTGTLLFGAALTLGVGLVSSVLPAWNASRLSVLDGLRTLG